MQSNFPSRLDQELGGGAKVNTLINVIKYNHAQSLIPKPCVWVCVCVWCNVLFQRPLEARTNPTWRDNLVLWLNLLISASDGSIQLWSCCFWTQLDTRSMWHVNKWTRAVMWYCHLYSLPPELQAEWWHPGVSCLQIRPAAGGWHRTSDCF